MTRKEMLSKLNSIRVGAKIKVITMDMGLQYEYVTSVGYGEGFGNMGEWPTYRIEILPSEVEKIKEKIIDRTLKEEDLSNTELLAFYKYVFRIARPNQFIPRIVDFFEGLLKIDVSEDEILYVLCDAGQWEPEAYFFATYEELEEAFKDKYVSYIEEWEKLKDEELESWLKRVEAELMGIPMMTMKE